MKLVKEKRKSRYPFAFPGLARDCYFPGSDIPRPIFKDVREYPLYFWVKKKRPGYMNRKGWGRREKPRLEPA
jgi:hypothetical protein